MNAPQSTDRFQLSRFITAQDPVWDAVRQELHAGRKQTHWMWFVFPQLAVLGRSSMARHFGLSGVEEAKAYLAHPVLGARLREVCTIVLRLQAGEAVDIFGPVDAMKLRSCLTLFAAAAPEDDLFTRCLQRYFGGEADPMTLSHIG